MENYDFNMLMKYKHWTVTEDYVSNEVFSCYISNCESNNKVPTNVSDFELCHGLTRYEYWLEDNKVHQVVSISCGDLASEVIADFVEDLDYFKDNCVY